MSFIVSNRDSQEIFERAARNIAKANSTPERKLTIADIDLNQLTQGYVETHANLVPNNSIIQWPIVDTQNISQAPITPLMRLLSMQDSFVVGSLHYSLLMYSYVNNQQNPAFDLYNYMTPITYPGYLNNFNLSGPPEQQISLSPGVSMFWNAYLSYTVDKKVIIPYWNTSRHYYAPQTQAQPQVNPVTGLPNVGAQFNVVQQLDGATDAFYPVEPTITMGGGRQNIWQLNLPANIPGNIFPFNLTNYNGTGAVAFIMKAVLKFHGILAQNSTSVK